MILTNEVSVTDPHSLQPDRDSDYHKAQSSIRQCFARLTSPSLHQRECRQCPSSLLSDSIQSRSSFPPLDTLSRTAGPLPASTTCLPPLLPSLWPHGPRRNRCSFPGGSQRAASPLGHWLCWPSHSQLQHWSPRWPDCSLTPLEGWASPCGFSGCPLGVWYWQPS